MYSKFCYIYVVATYDMSLAVIVLIEGISLRYRIDLRPVAAIGSNTDIPS